MRSVSIDPRGRHALALACAAAAACLAGACGRHQPDGGARQGPPETPQVAEAREARQTAAAELAPTPLAPPDPAPATAAAPLPLLGEDGRDAHGWPTRHVDRVALRALLLRGRYAELTRAVEALQDAFEEDPARERWPVDAAEALGTAEKELLPKLDAWVLASPGSFAPLLARGTHWVNAAFARRGGAVAAETARSDFDAMDDAVARAVPDLRRALELRPGLVAAMNALLRVNQLLPGGHRANARVIAAALRVCPSCFLVDLTYLHTLLPRWGGSYPLMRAHAGRRARARSPGAALLPGVIDLDKADVLSAAGKHREALALVERACRRGELWSFLLERASERLALSQVEEALADLDRAAQLRPGHPEVLYARAFGFLQAKRWEDAGRELRAGIQANPAHWRARHLLPTVVHDLVYAGSQRARQGDREGALRDLELAAELDPLNREVQGYRAGLVAGREAADPAALSSQLREAQLAVPDDFRAVQQLDYRLAREGRFGPVVGLWNEFLKRHPDHGPAYLERGGALFHLGRRAEALADARRACDLGVSEGCVRARQLGGAP